MIEIHQHNYQKGWNGKTYNGSIDLNDSTNFCNQVKVTSQDDMEGQHVTLLTYKLVQPI